MSKPYGDCPSGLGSSIPTQFGQPTVAQVFKHFEKSNVFPQGQGNTISAPNNNVVQNSPINPDWLHAPYAIGIKKERSGFGDDYIFYPVIYKRMRDINTSEDCFDHLPKDISPHTNRYFPRLTADGVLVFPIKFN